MKKMKDLKAAEVPGAPKVEVLRTLTPGRFPGDGVPEVVAPEVVVPKVVVPEGDEPGRKGSGKLAD